MSIVSEFKNKVDRAGPFEYAVCGAAGLIMSSVFFYDAVKFRRMRNQHSNFAKLIKSPGTIIWKGPLRLKKCSKNTPNIAYKEDQVSEYVINYNHVGLSWPIANFTRFADTTDTVWLHTKCFMNRFAGIGLPGVASKDPSLDMFHPMFKRRVKFDRVCTDFRDGREIKSLLVYADTPKKYTLAYRIKGRHVEYLAFTDGVLDSELQEHIVRYNFQSILQSIMGSMVFSTVFGCIMILI